VCRTILTAMAAAALLAAAPSPILAQSQGATAVSKPDNSGHAPLEGIELYYEIHGEGEPLVLLHGGMTVYETLGQMLPELAQDYRVIVPHMQGHGFTRDVERTLDYPTMAADVVALLDRLGV